MKRVLIGLLVAAVVLPGIALAHFMVVQPSANIVVDRNAGQVTVDMRFAHPFEQFIMDMAKPRQFGIVANGKKTDLTDSIKEIKKGKFRTWQTQYELKRPGDVIFYVEPAPYWEPAEDKHIIHYTKTIVHAFGLEEGWDEMVGFPIEIKPMTRPYGLWAGNLFTGQVLLEGKPVPYAEVEVAYDNHGNKYSSPAEVFNIQVVKADQNGIFSYAMPKAGWWGFAALEEAKQKIKDPDGKEKPVEIGAVIWTYATEMK